MEDSEWRSNNFRQKLVSQIEEAMRKAGVAHNKTSKDMENHVYMKAKSREEYLSLVARLIIHFRDIHNKKSQASDPMNALQNLTGGPPAGTAGMGMTSRPQGAPMGGMSGLGPMGPQINLPGQQQPPGAAGIATHGIPGMSTATQQSSSDAESHASEDRLPIPSNSCSAASQGDVARASPPVGQVSAIERRLGDLECRVAALEAICSTLSADYMALRQRNERNECLLRLHRAEIFRLKWRLKWQQRQLPRTTLQPPVAEGPMPAGELSQPASVPEGPQ